MPLSAGDRLGPYEIIAPVGKGGMGEVFRARDSRLNRDVAIKVSSEQFSERFTREARAIAALNHTNICHLYDVGPNYLVMEYVEGRDLSGPMDFNDARPLLHQLIDGIEAAHEKNIIHRDLKPANIRLTPEGVVKILDFGLAKAMDLTAADIDLHNSPTVALSATQVGTILGTAAYMAPEQARGKTVDKRSDIWSFGVILHEVLTGKHLFPGDTAVEILAGVLNANPDISAAPPRVHQLLRWCLEKDRKDRLAAIGDARRLLAEEDNAAALPPAFKATPITRHPLVWMLALIAVAATGFGLWNRPAAQVDKAAVRLTIPLPAGQEITGYPAITRDGRTVAYVSRQGTDDSQLYLRDLDSFEARTVPGSAGAHAPFFSPDGKWVAFFARGQLQKADVAGGAPIRLADVTVGFGGTWSDDNTIVYSPSLGGLWRIAASGGTAEQLTKTDGGASGYAHVYPQVLPGGKGLLFTIWGKESGVAVLPLSPGKDSARWQVVLTNHEGVASPGIIDPAGGRVLTVDRNAVIQAAPFDVTHPGSTAAGISVLTNVNFTETDMVGFLAVSNSGTAVYAPGNPAKRSLVWVNRDGKAEPASDEQGLYAETSLSPDGTKAAVRKAYALWNYDLKRGTSIVLPSPLNTSAFAPVWNRDGSRIVFGSPRAGDWDIYSQLADGSQQAELLVKRPDDQMPVSIASDGTLLFTDLKSGLWAMSPDGKTELAGAIPFSPGGIRLSPGQVGAPLRLAYSTNESGRSEIYLQSYPHGDKRIPVSKGGGTMPRWSGDGRELFYIAGQALVAVEIGPDGPVGSPRKLFDASKFLFSEGFTSYDVSPDGKRFLMIQRDPGSVPHQLNVILNWSGNNAAAPPRP